MKKLSVILLAVVMSVMMVVPVFAVDYGILDAPDIEKIPEFTNYPYAHISGKTLYLTNVPLSWSSEHAHYMKTAQGGLFTFYSYRLNSYGNWEALTSSTSSGFTETQIAWSNYDIYDFEGNLIIKGWEPPKPLYLAIQDVSSDTLNSETIPEVLNTFKTLAYVGVGLLAMLVVLELFGKRSLIKR